MGDLVSLPAGGVSPLARMKIWYTVKEAASYLGRTETAVRMLERHGKLEAKRPDGRLHFHIRELERFMGQPSDRMSSAS